MGWMPCAAVTRQRQALSGDTVHVHGRKRIDPAAADRTHGAEMAAETECHLGAERSIVHRHEMRGHAATLGPDDRRKVAAILRRRHRQLGEGAGGQEMLQRRPVMRLLMRDGADNAGLRIGPARSGDAGLAAQRRFPALCADHEPGLEHRAVLQGDGGVVRAARDMGLGGGMQRDAGGGVQAGVQRHAHAARLHHPAHRLAA